MHEHAIAAQVVTADVPERVLRALDVRQNILGCLSLVVSPESLHGGLAVSGSRDEIHADALEQEKEIRAKETAEIEKLLTDDQKAELKGAAEKAAADRKGKKKEGATTAPSAD